PVEDRFEDVRVSKASHIVFTQCREMRDRLTEVIANEPAISNVSFNLFNCLTHGANTEDALNKSNFDQYNWINTGPAIIFAVEILYKIIDEVEVDGIFNFTYEMIFWYKFIQRNKRHLSTAVQTSFSKQLQVLLTLNI